MKDVLAVYRIDGKKYELHCDGAGVLYSKEKGTGAILKHYAAGSNVQHYTVQFDNTKTATLTFDSAFSKKPMIQLTMNDSGNVPVYKTNVTTSSVKIRFKTKWTGEVDVVAMARDNT